MPRDDVKKLVNNAPPTLPALAQELQNPIRRPLSFFPNQFVNIVTVEGHPDDYIKPFKAKRIERKTVETKSNSAATPIITIIIVMLMSEI
jgi:hypothetical protein